MEILKVIISLILILLITKWLWHRRHLYWLSLHMKGPIGLPIVGSGLHYLMENKGNIKFFGNLFERYGSTFCIWFGLKLYVIVSNPEDVELVLTSSECINRPKIFAKAVKDVIGGDGLFTSESERWRKTRRIIAPSFNFGAILNYIPLFNKNSHDCVRQLDKYVEHEPFNIVPMINMISTASFLESSLSLELRQEDMLTYGYCVSEGQMIVGIRMHGPWYEPDFLWKLSKHKRRLNELQQFGNDLTESVMSKHVDNGTADVTFLQKLIRVAKENEDFSLHDVRSELTTIVTAATETTTWSISITLLLLAMHQDVQDKVVDELRQVFPNKHSDVMKEDLGKLKYLEMCIKEELRLFPSIPVFGKNVDRLFKLTNHDVPTDTTILINLFLVHRNSKYWGPNANKFNPERFSAENIGKIKPFSYLPFSGGPRNCIGERYAMMGIKTTLANILRTYKVTTPLKLEEISVHSNVNIFVNNLCMVQLERRNF